MPRHCPVCIHSQRAAIDEQMAAGERLGEIAGRYGLRVRDLRGHACHGGAPHGLYTRPRGP